MITALWQENKNEDALIRYKWKSRGGLFLTDPGGYLNHMYVEILVEFAEYRRDSSDTSGPRTSSYTERESLIDVMNMKQSGTETGTICSGTSGVQNWEIKEKWCFNLPQQVNKQWIHCLIVWTLFTNISLWVLLTADMMKLPSWSSWSLFFTRFSIRVFSKFMSLMSLVCSRQQDWGPKHSGTTGRRTGLQTSK